MRGNTIPVGHDGRNRCSLRPFASKTGRNQPRSSEFIFGTAAWLRALIKPAENTAVAYLDYEQQEFGIAAALSGDANMQHAYRSGDPYLAFAKQAGALPADATKVSHREIRERFKHAALAVQYGMAPKSLAKRLRTSLEKAAELLRLHHQTYPTYWLWSGAVVKSACAHGKLQAALGWTLNVADKPNKRSLRNFLLQANGAEILRLVCIALTESGIRVCGPVHDAILVEAGSQNTQEVIAACKDVMKQASSVVLGGFALRTDANIIQFPKRYMDQRGRAMWEKVFNLLDN
jgi:DNA polymerase I-like protein with 3'-5' exonuclease and polymerase domains